MFGKKNVFDILNIPSHLPAPPREGLFCALWDVTADAFMVSAVIVIFIVIPFVNFLLYFVFPFGIMTSQRTGKANTPGTPAGK